MLLKIKGSDGNLLFLFDRISVDQVRSILPASELLPSSGHAAVGGSNSNAGKMDQT